MICISFWFYLDQFKHMNKTVVFTFTTPRNIQSLQANATLTNTTLVSY